MRKKNYSNKKIRSKAAFRHGTLATVFTVLFIVAVVAVNVLSTALANRFPLELDLTADKINTLSDENLDFIEKVERNVNITVCATEEAFTNGTMNNLAYSTKNTVDPTATGTNAIGEYFPQTLKLIKDYPKYNGNIALKFMDPQEPGFSDITSKYPDVDFQYGDVLVESSFELEGKNINRYKVLTFDDLFETEDPSGGYAAYGMSNYQISGSRIETSLTSAIFIVTADRTTRVGLVTTHSKEESTALLIDTLEKNNYEFDEVNTVSADIAGDLDMIVIAAPISDFSDIELQRIEKYLNNNGNRGKSLMFFASAASPDLPNLYDFLEEWGINVSSGTLFETNAGNYIGTPTVIGLANSGTEYTADQNDKVGVVYVSGANVPMAIGYKSQGNRTVTGIMDTSETVVVKPKGAAEDWIPQENPETKQFNSAILSKDTIFLEDYSEASSYVVAFSSTDFITSQWASQSTVGNLDIILTVSNTLTGRADEGISFVDRSITATSYSESVTQFKLNVIMLVFMLVVPAILIILGVIVWLRRKNL